MSIKTTTHLNFPGTAADALAFYQSVFGGSVTSATYGDFGMPKEVPGAEKIVFGQLEAPDGFRLMAYDIPGQDSADAAATAGTTRRENGTTITDRTFFQSLRGQSLAEVDKLWGALADGAQIIEPLAASAWSPGFGMLTDRFGVTWVIDVEAPYNG
ncbi:VOC family protein [Arthrobacter zhangbolii]|uniref:VOC family protein n=1 Tax=Arthrobacter zhangbolii TaxID=2886936 RepID=A0A9X1M8R5_9MICC|nr:MULTISPECIES: VOC family protein [Arthrobacter]MCC3273558.1 VOC family protein [Arthrobacter zhangbolii]MDN3905826.1 VOC family protein [Arthrobacter sp. YD2]UON92370.1 VOC family protein [Arthrobacter zhangbolii]